jgi:hypothetical protein
MLKQFSSNTRKLNRIIPKINPNNLNDDLYITGSLLNVELPSSASYQSNTRKNPYGPTVINTNNINDSLYVTASLENIEIPTNTKFESKVRSNPNPIKLVNNKTKISEFYQEILENSARINQRIIDEFDNAANTLTIKNVILDYGTEGASPNNFEVLVFGLHIPGNYIIKEVGSDVVITLNEQYIDYDNVTINDIYVIGKLVDVPVATEDDSIIITEDGLDIII